MAIKIYIDQGHNPTGYPNTGASWYGQQEQDVTYAVGLYLAQMLREDGRFDVRLSRPTENTSSWRPWMARSEIAAVGTEKSPHFRASPSRETGPSATKVSCRLLMAWRVPWGAV